MHDAVKQLYHRTRRFHSEVYGLIVATRCSMANNKDNAEFVDTIYACKRAEEMTEDLGKELRKLLETYKRLCCLMWAAEMTGDPVRTPYCTGSPDTKVTYLAPKRGTPEYATFCQHYGVDPDGPFTPHWKKMIDAMTSLARQGLPPPPGIDPSASYTVFEVATRQKAGSSIEEPSREISREQLEELVAAGIDDSMTAQLESALRGALQTLPYANLSLAARRALIREAAMRVSESCTNTDLAEVEDKNDTPW